MRAPARPGETLGGPSAVEAHDAPEEDIDVSKFIIESRLQATSERSAGQWNRDGLVDPGFEMGGPNAGDLALDRPTHSLYEFETREEGERCAAELPGIDDDWARFEYRVREVP